MTDILVMRFRFRATITSESQKGMLYLLDTFQEVVGDDQIKMVQRPVEIIDELIEKMRIAGLEVVEK